MSMEENKALVRRFYEEVFNNKNMAGIDAFVDPNGIDHALPGNDHAVRRASHSGNIAAHGADQDVTNALDFGGLPDRREEGQRIDHRQAGRV